jgi:hypothetical protein
MSKKALWLPLFFPVLLLILVLGKGALSQDEPQKPPMPPPRNIPGITTADAFPRGCVDCHVNHPEMKLDARLSTALKRWTTKVEPKVLEKAQPAAPAGMALKGKHPDVSAMTKDIPKGCLACHASNSKMAPPMAQMIHRIHLTGGKENVFMTLYQGECTHCHKMDAAKGKWTIPSGPEKPST